jgi:hypothetical protein
MRFKIKHWRSKPLEISGLELEGNEYYININSIKCLNNIADNFDIMIIGSAFEKTIFVNNKNKGFK